MWSQIVTIAWAQFRISRNHLPRTSWGSFLMGLLTVAWYGSYATIAVVMAKAIPLLSGAELNKWLPIGLLIVFLFWQLVPLFTLSSGWSLQLNKLQVYPVEDSALFGIEVLLRLTTAPEMLIVLSGAFVGLLLRGGVPLFSPFLLFLFVPFNLFLSLGIRDWMLHNFERNRFREIFAIALISVGILPQLFLRTRLGEIAKPYFTAVANGRSTPWKGVAQLSSGTFTFKALLAALAWIALSYVFARRQFVKTLSASESFTVAAGSGRSGALSALASAPARLLGGTRAQQARIQARLPKNQRVPFQDGGVQPGLVRFKDPIAALVQKEFQTLLRMPRFRVVFGMACFFSCVALIPMTARNHANFISQNFASLANLYGLLMLGDLLLWNVFGFDRQAVQLYFVSPVQLDSVFIAKNLTAATFIAIQTLVSLLIASLFRMGLTWTAAAEAISASMVVALFFITAGNLSSVTIPRAVDASQTFRKQAGAKAQLWTLICMAAVFLLIGFAFLARWAVRNEWAFLAVLAVEFLTGWIAYGFSLESAVRRAGENREQILEALSKQAGPMNIQSS